MIKRFNHKGLKEIFENGKTRKLPQERLDKIKKLLFIINNAHQLEDINTPGSRLRKLKAPPYAGWNSVDVTANYRIVFQFTNGNVDDIDYTDTN